MQTQRGAIGVGVLIAIILAVVVLGGGAFFAMQQKAGSQVPIYQDQTIPSPATQETTKNTTETKAYDFSKEVLFYHTTASSPIRDLRIKDNLITWVQYTKQSPPFPEDVTNLFLFKTDPAHSQATISQVTNYEHQATRFSQSSSEANIRETIIMNGNIYWITPTENLPSGDLYVYDSSSQKTELLLKDILELVGTRNNTSIVFKRRQDIDLPLDPKIKHLTRSYQTTEVGASYNVLTRQEEPQAPCSSGDCLPEEIGKIIYKSTPAKQIGKTMYYLQPIPPSGFQLIQSDPWTGHEKVVATLNNLVGIWALEDGNNKAMWDTDGEYVVYQRTDGLVLKKLEK